MTLYDSVFRICPFKGRSLSKTILTRKSAKLLQLTFFANINKTIYIIVVTLGMVYVLGLSDIS